MLGAQSRGLIKPGLCRSYLTIFGKDRRTSAKTKPHLPRSESMYNGAKAKSDIPDKNSPPPLSTALHRLIKINIQLLVLSAYLTNVED